MDSVEFGLVPLQTIYDRNILSCLKKNSYEKIDKIFEKEMKIQNKQKSNSIKITKNERKNYNEILKEIKNEDEENYSVVDEIDENYFQNAYNDYWEEPLNIKFKINNDDEIGNLEIYKNDILKYKLYDHSNKILDCFYNKRLNMFGTTSLDGYICIYILPNKLISMIKHPRSYFERIFLSANPFPSIIAYDKKENIIVSYSLSGILINSIQLDNKIIFNVELNIIPLFNMYGGTFKDKINIYSEFGQSLIIRVPSLITEKSTFNLFN